MCEKNILQLPNEILEEIIWRILDYDENLELNSIIRPYEQRVFLLTKYTRICKKFQDIIRRIINRQKLQVIIMRKRKCCCTIAVELNDNRLLIESNSLLRKYVEQKEHLKWRNNEIEKV